METVVKFISNIVQLYLVYKVVIFAFRCATGRLFRSSKKRSRNRRDSIMFRLYKLGINPILYRLDDLLYNQKQKRLEALAERQACKEEINKCNVISFNNIKKSKNAK